MSRWSAGARSQPCSEEAPRAFETIERSHDPRNTGPDATTNPMCRAPTGSPGETWGSTLGAPPERTSGWGLLPSPSLRRSTQRLGAKAQRDTSTFPPSPRTRRARCETRSDGNKRRYPPLRWSQSVRNSSCGPPTRPAHAPARRQRLWEASATGTAWLDIGDAVRLEIQTLEPTWPRPRVPAGETAAPLTTAPFGHGPPGLEVSQPSLGLKIPRPVLLATS